MRFRKMVLQLCRGRSVAGNSSAEPRLLELLRGVLEWTLKASSDTWAVLASTPPAGDKAGRELGSHSSGIHVARSVIIPVDTLE